MTKNAAGTITGLKKTLAEKRINEEIRKRGGTDLSLAQVLGDREETETAARPDDGFSNAIPAM